MLVILVSILIFWSVGDESDLAGYRVHWGNESRNYQHGIQTPDSSLRIYDFENYLSGEFEIDTVYFAVTAYDTIGNESNYSDEVIAIFYGYKFLIRKGDVTGDDKITLQDFYVAYDMIFTQYGDSLYHPMADINQDSVISLQDVYEIYDMIWR